MRSPERPSSCLLLLTMYNFGIATRILLWECLLGDTFAQYSDSYFRECVKGSGFRNTHRVDLDQDLEFFRMDPGLYCSLLLTMCNVGAETKI